MTAFSRDEIMRAWRLFRQAGDVVELRIPKAGKFKTISGYFNDPAAFADAVVVSRTRRLFGSFSCLKATGPQNTTNLDTFFLFLPKITYILVTQSKVIEGKRAKADLSHPPR